MEKFSKGGYDVIMGIDTGLKLVWAGTKIIRIPSNSDDVDALDYYEENFKFSSKQYHDLTKFKLREKKRKKVTRTFERAERQDMEIVREELNEFPSCRSPSYEQYVHFHLQRFCAAPNVRIFILFIEFIYHFCL